MLIHLVSRYINVIDNRKDRCIIRNNLAVDKIPLAESLTYIKKNKAFKIEPCGTPAGTKVHAEVLPFSTTLWSLLYRKI